VAAVAGLLYQAATAATAGSHQAAAAAVELQKRERHLEQVEPAVLEWRSLQPIFKK
jgi:hypothetical protein